MNYQTFQFNAESWMRLVCNDLLAEDVFSPYSHFEFLYDYDFDSKLVVGFRIVTFNSISMGDSVYLNKICEKYSCFYRICPNVNSLSFNFYLESHG